MADENKYNVKIECGTDFVLPFVWTDDNGNPYDLTGATVTAQLREYSGSPDALDFVCTHNNAGGRIMLIMPNEVTKQITYSYGVYDVNVMLASGVVKHPLYGEAKIQGAVTKPLDGEMLITVAIESYDKLPAQGLLNRLYYVYAEQMILRWNGTNYVSALEQMTLHNEGAWDEETAYQKYATVTNAGSSYLALRNVPEDTDIHDTAYWLKLAEAGGAVNIDDTAGEGDTTVTWSADKIHNELYKQQLENGNVLYLFPEINSSLVGDHPQHNCALVITQTKTILFDAGSINNWDTISAYFDKLVSDGILNNIDYIILSHYHTDHYGCLENILGRYPHNGCIAYIPRDTIFSTLESAKQAYLDVKAILTNANVVQNEISADTTVTIEEQSPIEFTIINGTPADWQYYLDTLDSPNLNVTSLVTLFRHGMVYSMFPADAEIEAQVRIRNIHTLPKVFLYQIAHHDYENEIDMEFLGKIKPDISLTTKSVAKMNALINDRYGSMDYMSEYAPDTKLYSIAYRPAEFVTDGKSGNVIKGDLINLPYINPEKEIDVYVDNSYTGTIQDGSADHPYADIKQVLRIYDKNVNINLIATETVYNHFEICYKRSIHITGVNNDNVKPKVNSINVHDCDYVRIENIDFPNKPNVKLNSAYPQLHLNYIKYAYIRNCDFTYTDKTKNTYTSILVSGSNAYVVSCSFNNTYYGILGLVYSKIIINGLTFNDCVSCIRTANMEILVRPEETTVTNCTTFLESNGQQYTYPLRLPLSYDWLKNLISLIDVSVATHPYSTGNNGSEQILYLYRRKIFDLLSGTVVYPPSE